MSQESCRVKVIHPEKVARVSAHLQRHGTYQDLSDVFRALGDESRVKILDALSCEELCVCDISAILGMSPSAVSHHLRTLRNLQLVRHRRAGKKIYYTLRDRHVTLLLTQGLEHMNHR